MIKKILILVLIIAFSFSAGYFLKEFIKNSTKTIKEKNITLKKDKPLEKYSFENLSNTDILPGKIVLTEIIQEENYYTSYLFNFIFNPNLDGKTLKTSTGQINVPKRSSELSNFKYPVVIMFRGYIDQKLYKTGDGTRNASSFFAENGFITISPDFLGYAGSDKETNNIFESRFQTYVTAVSLIKTVEQIKNNPSLIGNALKDSSETLNLDNLFSNSSNIFIWGHSNGGQIALTALELTQTQHPTTLWAPVSKPFPYSILYYTDESDDHGKLIRNELSSFEKDYDVEKYSLTNYLSEIKAPIQIHQGGNDASVPISWSNSLVAQLKNLDLQYKYYTYPSADHNMRPDWNTVVERDIEYFNSFISN